jgi:acyl dehydratase
MSEAWGVVKVAGAEEVRQLAGRGLGPTSWLQVDQQGVDAFARSVQDWHWAHNDPERAGRGPFGGPIAHAHMTLALVPHFREELISFASGECMFYGYNRVRFPAAVPVGARVRMHGTVVQVAMSREASSSPSTFASRSRARNVPPVSRRRSGGTTTSNHDERGLVGLGRSSHPCSPRANTTTVPGVVSV